MEHLSFGTDGIRGPADQFPFTDKPLRQLAYAIALWAIEKYGNSPQILIGRDTRASGPRMLKAITNGLQAAGTKIIDGGVLPTPAVFTLMHHYREIPVGIVISASHNPAPDNGIKMFDLKQGKLTKDDEARICEIYAQNKEIKAINSITKQEKTAENYAQDYIDIVTKKFPVNMLAGKKIILDCAHGATYKVAPEIFKRLGAEVIALSTSPDGYNINKSCGALHLDNLKKEVVKHNAYAGFAFDGDGDRIMAVNNQGETRDGDDILAILSEHPDYDSQPSIVATIMSNYGLESALKAKNKALIRTPVGDKYVGAYMSKHNLLIGGEISGHIILADHVNSGDGIFAALRVAQQMVMHNNSDMNSFEKCPQALKNIKISDKKDLTNEPYRTIINDHQSQLKNGRIIARYSGTENVLRLMVEDQTIEHAQKILHSLAQNLA